MKTILIPTDFSSSANNALRVAALIARQAKAEIHLLHSVRTNIDWAHLPIEKRGSYPETLANIEKAESQLEKESWKPLLKGLKIHTHLVTGNTFEQIIHFANKKVKADLVVMGSHGPDEPKELYWLQCTEDHENGAVSCAHSQEKLQRKDVQENYVCF